MSSEKPRVPPSLNMAAIVGGIVGVIYMIVGLVAFAEAAAAPVFTFFGLAGFAMVFGGVGLLAGKRWARRWATFGVGALLAVHAFATMAVVFAIIIGLPGRPDGAWLAATSLVSITALFTWIFRQFRSDQTQHFLWASEEAKLEVALHEVPTEGESQVTLDFSEEPAEATAKR